MTQPDRITIRRPDDFHVHLRQGTLLEQVLGPTAAVFARALLMPNTVPPLLGWGDIFNYRTLVQNAISRGRFSFEPFFSLQITESTQYETVQSAFRHGRAIAGKIYPRGMTTNSENGVLDYHKIFPALAAMQECGMVACFHGETPQGGVFCLDRESAFLGTLNMIVKNFPRLKIVLEHITTRKAVNWIMEMPANVAATITVHHLILTLDDVIGGKLQTHNFCKPVAKRPEDREALIAAAMSGDPKFFLGTDSAPHPVSDKECAHGCAGVYTAPVALPLLADVFDKRSLLERLDNFTSRFGAEFYGLPLNEGTITLVRRRQVVPATANGIVPFMAGRQIEWSVEAA